MPPSSISKFQVKQNPLGIVLILTKELKIRNLISNLINNSNSLYLIIICKILIAIWTYYYLTVILVKYSEITLFPIYLEIKASQNLKFFIETRQNTLVRVAFCA